MTETSTEAYSFKRGEPVVKRNGRIKGHVIIGGRGPSILIKTRTGSEMKVEARDFRPDPSGQPLTKINNAAKPHAFTKAKDDLDPDPLCTVCQWREAHAVHSDEGS